MGNTQFSGAQRALGALGVSVAIFASTLAAQALVPVPNDPNDPSTTPKPGPGLPYISGRLGSTQVAPSSAPEGDVVPDDFCLPGKFDDCGSHLRDGPVVQEQVGPIFVGGEDLAFFESRYSAWANAAVRRTTDSNTSETRNLTALSFGADRKFGEDLIFGLMAVTSQSTIDFATTNIFDQADGFYVGPYFSFRLGQNVYLDGRYYYGTSNHDVLTGGAQTGSYQSTDSFGALRFSAEIERQNWKIYPSLEFAQERQASDAYTDTASGAVPAATSTHTYVTVAALGYFTAIEGVSPYGGLELSQETSTGSMSGTLRGGAAMTFDNGSVLNFDYAYGGLGLSGIDDQQLSVRFEIPF